MMLAILAAAVAFGIVLYAHHRFIRDGDRKATLIVLASWVVGAWLIFAAVGEIVSPGNQRSDGEVVASINGIRDTDGVIHFIPPYCGPNAHVENHPKYGQLCIQDEGSWKVAVVGGERRVPPCIGPNGSNARPDGLLWSCQGSTIEVR